MRILFALVLSCLNTHSFCQEICDNGIDDDGDGLIDLNDTTECSCEGLIFIDSIFQGSLIPNSSFEEKICCPYFYSQMNCANNWEQASWGTSDYMNTCDFVSLSVIDQGLVPFPDGEGAVGAFYTDVGKEYVGCCLFNPLEAGVCYQLSFYIASTPSADQTQTCNNGTIYYGDVPITIFGNPSCTALPFTGYQCPPSSGGWLELGNTNYSPTSSWEMITIEFTPTTDIESIVIGSPCNLPPEYVYLDPVCGPYFVYDKLILKEGCGYQIGINNTYDQPCANLSELSAYSNLSNGTWQWYYNGIAISGETDSILHLNTQINGNYTVIYQSGFNCFGATYNVNYFPPSDENIHEIACGSFYWESTGAEYYQSGNYQAIFEAVNGCDSIINLELIISNDESYFLDTTICQNDTLIIDGIQYSSPGSYFQTLNASSGCDSILNINLSLVDSTTPHITFLEPVCMGEIITLYTSQIPTYNLYWTLPSGETLQGNSIQIAYNNSTIGQYHLTESYSGCISGFDEIELHDNYNSLDLNNVIIPNVITPNNDGINDQFLISGIPEGCYYSLEIINRWGNLMFTQTESSDLFVGASSDGNILSEGVYLYVLKFNESRTSGFVHLIR